MEFMKGAQLYDYFIKLPIDSYLNIAAYADTQAERQQRKPIFNLFKELNKTFIETGTR